MKIVSILASIQLLSLSVLAAKDIECISGNKLAYDTPADYSLTLQELIDDASRREFGVVYLSPGVFNIDPNNPIILKQGVSLKGSTTRPTIISVKNATESGSIEVPESNSGWSIQDITFENVNIKIEDQTNEDEVAILGNLFFNGETASVWASNGHRLHIDGNIFLRDELHQGTDMKPRPNTTNSAVRFDKFDNSVVQNNIFGIDLRNMNSLVPHVPQELDRPLRDLKFIYECLQRPADEQGYMESGVQLSGTNDITIIHNIMNATFPDTKQIAQDHAISVVGSNSTYILQNFMAGWVVGDFGGAARITSAVDAYIISNYLANSAVMMYVAGHADYPQISNMVVANNFLYKFLGHEFDPPVPTDGWLNEGITFFDFYTTRQNNTVKPPIDWNATIPISSLGWDIIISENKFGATTDLDPNVISLGNLDLSEAYVDQKNCYVTEPLIPGADSAEVIPVLSQRQYEEGVFSRNGGRIPERVDRYTKDDLTDRIPAHLRNLPIPSYWKAFVLKNNTVPMIDPSLPCYTSLEY